MERGTAMNQIKDLEKIANRVRRQVLEAAASGGMVHFGGTYSCTDLMVALYYGGQFNLDPKNPGWAATKANTPPAIASRFRVLNSRCNGSFTMLTRLTYAS